MHREAGNAVLTHYNAQTTIDIFGTADGRDLGGVSDDIRRIIDASKAELPKSSTIEVRGQVQTMNESFSGLLAGLLFAVLLVYLLIVVNFQSWLDPFIIITALPGAYAQVHFALGAGTVSFTLPGNALLFRPDGVKVATVDTQHKVKLLPVSLGTDFGTRVAIVSGLQGNEQVILNPQDSIVDGAPVRIVPRKAESGEGAAGATG
ncbi:Cation/multidrug efflux pump-like protein, partial [Burkholderia sp. H160]